jgi:hypothetical protein
MLIHKPAGEAGVYWEVSRMSIKSRAKGLRTASAGRRSFLKTAGAAGVAVAATLGFPNISRA